MARKTKAELEAAASKAVEAVNAASVGYVWETLTVEDGPAVRRMRIPGGWLVAVDGVGCTTVHDGHGLWDGLDDGDPSAV